VADMFVDLYGPAPRDRSRDLAADGIRVERALPMDRETVVRFVAETFADAPGWAAEIDAALNARPPRLMVAIRDKAPVGFCAWDQAALGVLGPVGVAEAHRGRGVAAELLRRALEAMKAQGYAYAAIGWVQSEDFYARACGAAPSPFRGPGLYARRIGA